jgi:pilus assembly protein CpaE
VTLVVEPDGQFGATLSFALGEDVRRVDGLAAVGRDLEEHPEEALVVVGPDVDGAQALELAASWQVDRPHVGVVLLRRRIDVQVLAEALRAGVREVVGPDDLGAVVTAARRSLELSRRRRLAERAAGPGEGPGGRVVTVFSAKGGCGKTTVATNLAAVLAADGSTRVCLVDLDLEFGDVAITVQVVPERTLVDLVPMAGTMDEHGVRSVLTPVLSGVDAVLAPTTPGQACQVDPTVVGELIRVLRSMYDVVLLDTPPAMNEHVLAAFDLSDTLLLLATLDVPALKNLKVSLDTLDLLGYPRESRLVVLNRADARVGLDLADVEETIGAAVSVQVPSSGDVPAATNRGRLLVREQPGHAVSRALVDLGGRLAAAGAVPAVTGRPPARRWSLRRGGGR